METTEKEIQIPAPGKLGRRAAMLLGGAAMAGIAISRRAMAQSSSVTDVDILNFALNLEYLEAQFYTLATTGKTIDQIGIGITGPNSAAGGTVTVKSNPMVPFVTPLASTVCRGDCHRRAEPCEVPPHGAGFSRSGHAEYRFDE